MTWDEGNEITRTLITLHIQRGCEEPLVTCNCDLHALYEQVEKSVAPADAVWVLVHPRNPRAKDYPFTGWVTAEDWVLKGGQSQFHEVQVHFKTETVALPLIILVAAQ